MSQILVTMMKEALCSSETSVQQEAHGVTSQKTPFFSIPGSFPTVRRILIFHFITLLSAT
jgi:hypothetical protein